MSSVNLPATHERAVRELAAWVRERFGGRVRDVRLFGSYARGEAREDSDVDVLVVVDGLTNAEAREIAYHTGDLLTEYHVLVSALALSREHYDELVSRERAIVQEIQRDGVPLLVEGNPGEQESGRAASAAARLLGMGEATIVSDPQVMMGKPVIAGTRITVELILEKLAAGESTAQILEAHPNLTEASIRAALAFAARALRS